VTREHSKAEFVDAAYFGAGLAALKQKKNEEARQRFQTVINNYRKSEDRPQAMLIVAQMDLDAKKYKDARAGFEAMLGDPTVKAQGGETLRAAEDGVIQSMLQAGEYAAAAPYLEKALARIPANDPMRFRAHLSLGHSRYHLKQYDKAFASYVDASKSGEGNVSAEAHYWAANSALALKKPQDAAEHFSIVASKHPRHELAAKAQFRAGESLESANQLEKAVGAYRATIEKYEKTPQAAEAKKALVELVASIDEPKLLASVLAGLPAEDRAAGQLRLGRLHIAAKAYDQAIQAVAPLAKSSAEAAYITGLAYEAQNKPQPAAAALSDAVDRGEKAPWAADACGRLAWLYLDLKQAANAESAAAKALALKPEAKLEQQVRLAMVQSQLDQKKWDPALQGAETLLKLNPSPETTATVLFTQAWILQKGKQTPEQALPIWERLYREFPKNNYAADALFYIGEGRAKAEKHEEAREKYAQILQSFPKHALATEARFRIGLAYYNLNKFAEAAAELDAVSQIPDAGELVPEALYWAGVSLDKAGKKTDAIQRLDRFVTKYSNYPNQERVKNARLRLAALRAVAGGSH
jgi:TolA-binding protein